MCKVQIGMNLFRLLPLRVAQIIFKFMLSGRATGGVPKSVSCFKTCGYVKESISHHVPMEGPCFGIKEYFKFRLTS